ncbi:unnamed protein product [Adineta steineri]|uniref:Beta-lactamase-related domain-containing protein n=1 Tax=Adineta steineri TaxID=433720 RepID=A0A819CIP2_9BILA|nr:unnamed protein product [Adineta steineri]
MIVLALILVVNGSTCPNRQSIEESLKQVHIPGAVIIVVNATHTLYEQAFGYQSISSQQPMDVEKSIFALGSISKTFIAVAVMQLVEQELIDLDTDINEYLAESQKRIYHPRYPSHAITLRKLLSHSASIDVRPDAQNTYLQSNDDAYSESLADGCFRYLNSNPSNWLPKPPGSVTWYANLGAALAALIVEQVANMSYIDYIEERILKPLGVDISKTGVRLADFENTEDLVKHYVYAFNASDLEQWHKFISHLNTTQMTHDLPTWLYIPYFGFSVYPSGLLRMSARVLSVYLQMFLRNGSSILSPRSIAEIEIVVGGGLIPYYNQNLGSNSTGQRAPFQFGLSWYWDTLSDGRRYFGHGGSLPGIINLMLVNEKRHVGVIVLSNGDATSGTNLAQEVIRTLENIHRSLFQCFDTDVVHASAADTKGTVIGLFSAIFILYAIFG